MEYKPEPTAGGELSPATMNEPETNEQAIALKPEPRSDSNQVCELATSIPMRVLVELDTEEWLIDW